MRCWGLEAMDRKLCETLASFAGDLTAVRITGVNVLTKCPECESSMYYSFITGQTVTEVTTT